jgi:hypothetical protein
MDLLHRSGGELHEGMPVRRDEPLEAEGDAVDVLHVVGVVQLEHDAPDHVVDARAESPARDDAALGLGRVEEDLPARSREFEGQRYGLAFRTPVVERQRGVDDDPLAVVHKDGRPMDGRLDARFSQGPHRGVHMLFDDAAIHITLRIRLRYR